MKFVIEEKINNFIALVSEKYPQLFVGYEKNSRTNIYKIWHNNEDLEYNNKDFRIFTGRLLTEIFLDSDIFNVYMTYDYDNSIAIKSEEFVFVKSEDELINYVEIKCEVGLADEYIIKNDAKYVGDSPKELKQKNIANIVSASNDNFALAA